jgi:two-component system chemotaxis sensor kinase CheA
MKNESGEMVGVVVVATDNTLEVNAKKRELEEINFSKMILKIARDQKDFLDFYQQVESLFQDSFSLLSDQEIIKTNKFNEINLNLHTIKGAVSLFYLHNISDAIHELEQSLIDSGDAKFDIDLTKNDLETIHKLFGNFISKIKDILPNLSSYENSYLISRISLERFSEELDSAELKAQFHEQFIKQDIETLFSKYNDLIHQVANEQNKDVYDLKFTGDKVKIDSEHYTELFTSFVHLFRNMIDHGIEDTSTRELNGKSSKGTISINLEVRDNDLYIQFSDDGKGIDPNTIREKLGDGHAEISDDEVLQSIFKSGFSTAESVTNLSGRGVGMGAVAKEVEKLNGSIKVESSLGESTKILIRIPTL